MTSFNNLNSSAISKVEVNDSDVMITYTTSGNEYKYALNGITSSEQFTLTFHRNKDTSRKTPTTT